MKFCGYQSFICVLRRRHIMETQHSYGLRKRGRPSSTRSGEPPPKRKKKTTMTKKKKKDPPKEPTPIPSPPLPSYSPVAPISPILTPDLEKELRKSAEKVVVAAAAAPPSAGDPPPPPRTGGSDTSELEKKRWETLLLHQQVTELELKNLRGAMDMLYAINERFQDDPYRGTFVENEDGTLRRADGTDIRFTPDATVKELFRAKVMEVLNTINTGQLVTDLRNPHQLMTVWSVSIRIEQLGCAFPPRTPAREKKRVKQAIGKRATALIKRRLGREPFRVARTVNGVHVPTNAYCTPEELELLDQAIIEQFADEYGEQEDGGGDDDELVSRPMQRSNATLVLDDLLLPEEGEEDE